MLAVSDGSDRVVRDQRESFVVAGVRLGDSAAGAWASVVNDNSAPAILIKLKPFHGIPSPCRTSGRGPERSHAARLPSSLFCDFQGRSAGVSDLRYEEERWESRVQRGLQ